MSGTLDIVTTGGRRFALHGDLDLSTAMQLVDATADATAEGGDLVLDLSGLVFVDSTGLHAFHSIANALPSGRVVLEAATGSPAVALEIAGFATHEKIHVVPAADPPGGVTSSG